MQLTPRYDSSPVLRVDTPFADPAIPLLRQRRRLAALLDDLSPSDWVRPSRCDGWTAKDVIAHLVGTNRFWTYSIKSGLEGNPTQLLATFDPVATPAQMVEGTRAQEAAAVLDELVETTEEMAAALAGVEGEAWAITAEAPPGHVSLRAVVLHALWDSWIHERDVLIPLGDDTVEEADEVVGCLTYSAAIGPALLAAGGSTRPGSLAIDATEPSLQLTVELGATAVVRAGAGDAGVPCISGRAVDLVEGLSFRAPLDHGLGTEHEWMLEGLAEVFDRS
ncbi:MAG: maleylpyruvate isomerase family mycothiol-dependent enzyme [Actinomycetota bacterium]